MMMNWLKTTLLIIRKSFLLLAALCLATGRFSCLVIANPSSFPHPVPLVTDFNIENFHNMDVNLLYKYQEELNRLLTLVQYQIELQTPEGASASARIKRQNDEIPPTTSPNNSTIAELDMTVSEGLNFTEPQLFDSFAADDPQFRNFTEYTTSTSATVTTSIAANRTTVRPSVPRMHQVKNLTINNDCQQLTQDQLVSELKEKGTYNPDFMAWDVPGVIRFLEKTATTKTYDSDPKKKENKNAAVEKNLSALERILRELGVKCDVRSAEVIAKLYNITYSKHHPSKGDLGDIGRLRSKRQVPYGEKMFDYYQRSKYLYNLYTSPSRDDVGRKDNENIEKLEDKLIGQVHIVPFGCDKRGSEEDGYLRLCGACQAIRRLPDEFFPPFINEVMCDEDKACLYFYDFPHGKCKQKQMNFVVLRNVGSPECQIWRQYNLNVRVSCECFVDEMSFFAKYV